MDNTLDDILPDLRQLLPASIRGAYLDGYVRRRRTPMELLLSRSLPNTHPAASTFEDVRAEIQALGMPQWVANRYLSEAEQALAVGQDTREVVDRAKAWMATGLVNDPREQADFAAVLQLVRGRGAYYEGSGHKLAEGMTDEAVATRLWDAGFRAHMDLVDDGARLLRAAGQTLPPLAAPLGIRHLGPDASKDELSRARFAEHDDASKEALSREAYWNSPEKLAEARAAIRSQEARVDEANMRQKAANDAMSQRISPIFRTGTVLTARGDFVLAGASGHKISAKAGQVFWVTSSETLQKAEGGVRVDRKGRGSANGGLLFKPADIDKFFVVDQTANAVVAAPQVTTVIPQNTILTVRDDFQFRGEHGRKVTAKAGQAFWVTSSKILQASEGGVRIDRKGKGSLSNGYLFSPSDIEKFFVIDRPKHAVSPIANVEKERHWRDTYRTEAEVLSDIFNEEGTWQAATRSRTSNTIRLAIYPESLGEGHAVAVATIHDGAAEIEWLSATLTPRERGEISRRLQTAVAANGSDADAASPLAELTAATEKRALELGAKPARTRSVGRVTSDNPEERRLGEAVRDLRDRSDFDDAVTWLEAAELNIPFDIGERTSELDAVDKIMSEMWASILNTSTIALGGVHGEGRGGERVFYVSPEMIFDAGSLPFLLHRAMDNPSGLTYGPATLKEVAVKIVDPGDDDTYSAKVIDRDKVLKNDSMVHANERGAHFIRSLYRNMKLLRDDLERAPKALDDVRKLLYWTGAMLDTPRCQDATHSRALASFEAAKVMYDEVRQRIVSRATTSDEVARIKAPLRKAAVSAANLATECGEGQVDIFSARPQLPSPDELPSRVVHEPPPIPSEGPETPLHEQDRHSVDVLERLIASLSTEFIVAPIRAGHGYRVVDLRSRHVDGVFAGLPPNTYLTTVSLRHSGPSQIIGDRAYLVQSTRDAGLSHDHHRAIRRFVVETVERMTDEAQGKVPVAEDAPEDSDVTTKSFASRMPTKYLRDFFAEKDIPEVHWQLTDKSGVEHMLSNLVVVEHIAQVTKADADAIGNMLRRLDFENRDINGYLKHLAQGLVEKYASDAEFHGEAAAPVQIDAPKIFLPFSWVLPPRLADYYKPMRPGDPARFGDLPSLPVDKVRQQIAALDSLPPGFMEALKRYMIEVAELSLENVARNGYGVWQAPAVFAEVGPANVKIVQTNRGSDGSLAEHGNIHTLVRRKDGAILKYLAPPASAVRGNIYKSSAEIRNSITSSGPISRR